MNKVRQRCLNLYPDREELYEMVYESRFQRLWDQFRCEPEETKHEPRFVDGLTVAA